MQNAGFAALGLDWAYVPLPTPPESLADAVRGLVALGFAGANVTTPHKEAVLELLRRARRRRRARRLREHARDPRGPRPRLVDRRARRDLADRRRTGGARSSSATGGASKAVAAALERRRRRGGRPRPARPGAGRRRAEGFDVLVNATPVKDELVVAPRAGMQVVDLAYHADGRPTALIAARDQARLRIRASTGSTCCSRRAPRRSSAGRERRRRSSRCGPRSARPSRPCGRRCSSS